MLRPSHKMSHCHPIICCFRVLKKIKVTISHLLFNTPSLSACSGPSFSPPCVLSLCLSLSPPSVVFDESTFSLCFSQSSICLSTLCLTSPHAHTHDVHINIAVGPSSHTHSSSSAHTHTWTYRSMNTHFYPQCSLTAEFTFSYTCQVQHF